jgi:Domain of unknown function (DUF4412)
MLWQHLALHVLQGLPAGAPSGSKRKDMPMRRLVLAAAACGLWLPAVQAAAAEDLTIVSEVVVPKPYLVGPKNATLTLWMTPGKVRQSDGHRDWIYDAATGTRIDIDHQTRQYWQGTEAERTAWIEARNKEAIAKFETDKAEYQKQKAGRDEEFAKLEAEGLLPAVKDAPQSEREWSKLTPEERDDLRREISKLKEVLEQLAKAKEEFVKLPQALRDSMGKRPPPNLVGYAPTVERGTGDKAIAGYDCEHYRISVTRTFEDGSKKTEVEQELWLAEKLEPPVSFEVLKLAPFLSGVHLAKGFPLASISPSQGGSFHLSVIAVVIRKDPIDASVFALPAGYTRVDSPIDVVGSYSSDLK